MALAKSCATEIPTAVTRGPQETSKWNKGPPNWLGAPLPTTTTRVAKWANRSPPKEAPSVPTPTPEEVASQEKTEIVEVGDGMLLLDNLEDKTAETASAQIISCMAKVCVSQESVTVAEDMDGFQTDTPAEASDAPGDE